MPTRTIHARSRLLTRLAVGGMALTLLALAALVVWASVVTKNHTQDLSQAGVQTSGHLRAVQALGQIDTHTDLLEDGIDPRLVAKLGAAERLLRQSLARMETDSVVLSERQLAHRAKADVRALFPAVEMFVAALRDGNERRAEAAEERMDEMLDDLQLRFSDVSFDPSEVLGRETAAAAVSQRTIDRTSLVLIPIAALFLALSAWQLRNYRKHSEAAMFAALQRSHEDARTDELTGLQNRRWLLEALEQRAKRDRPFALALADLNGFKHYNDRYGHAAGDALLRRLADRLSAACDGIGTPARLGGDEFCVLVDAHVGADELAALMCGALAEEGEGFRITSACGIVRIPHDVADSRVALRLADARMYAVKDQSRSTDDQDVCDLLLRMLDARHPGLGDHVEAVATLAAACGEALGLPSHDIHDIWRAGQMHDIGKVAIPESIVAKPGRLNDEEWDFMRQHTIIGERVLAGVRATESVATIVRSSHERWDGGGYPDGIGREAIPLAARVVFVADAFCAMIDDRPYRPAMSTEDALDELRRCAGTQFDPAVVEAFIAAFEQREAAQATGPASSVALSPA